MSITTYTGTPDEILAQIQDAAPARFVSIHCNCESSVSALQDAFTGAAFHGSTSCLGAMTERGAAEDCAVFALSEDNGDFGTAMRPFGGNAFAAAQAATQAALQDADRLGEAPELIWVSTTPGVEEEVLDGIQSVTGADVPIIGGSAADNTVSGNWFVFDRHGTEAEGVIVSVLFPHSKISFAYQYGYAPTEHQGVVTKCDGRTVHEIDGRPAFDVYSEWTGGAVAAAPGPDEPEAILSQSTLSPLGREISKVGQVPYYLLAHPAAVHATGAMDMFATVSEGEELTCMTGTVGGLTERAGRVTDLAMAAGKIPASEVKGALMIYCGGCMLTVREHLADVVSGVNTALQGAPFLGAFTFGEQGAVLGAGNRHGNLMISCIVFS